MNIAWLVACLPVAIPALFLSFKLVEKKYLGTLFNRSLALLFALSGIDFGLKLTIISQSYRNIYLSYPWYHSPSGT